MPSDTPNRADPCATALQDHIRRIIAESPPLSDEKRERIAALLRIGGAA